MAEIPDDLLRRLRTASIELRVELTGNAPNPEVVKDAILDLYDLIYDSLEDERMDSPFWISDGDVDD